MKTMLLLLVALAISAKTLDKYRSAPIPNEYFTDGRLNGYWWAHASPSERQIYIQAWQDATGAKISEVRYGNTDLNLPLGEMLYPLRKSILNCTPARSGLAER